MNKYKFIQKIHPCNIITINAENEEKAKGIFIEIFGSLTNYKIEKA